MGAAVLRESHKAAGIENAAQQTPLRQRTRRIENVYPCSFVTEMSARSRKAMPAPRESAALTSSSPLRKNGVPRRSTVTVAVVCR